MPSHLQHPILLALGFLGLIYWIEYAPESEEHLRFLTARQQAMVLDTVDEQLMYQPTVETKNRKLMRPNPLAPLGTSHW